MASKMVLVVDSTTSKADEIAALRKMRECAGRGSYLRSLFTTELLAWVEGQIEMDLPPDIMEQLEHQRDREQKVVMELSRTRKELADADRKAGWAAKQVEDRHQQEIAKLDDRLKRWRQSVARWREEAQAARAKAEAYRDALLWAWGWVGWLLIKRDEAEALVEQTKVKAFTMLEKALLGKPQEDGDEKV